MMNALEKLAGFITDLAPDAIDPAMQDKLRLHVADVLGGWVAAAHTADGRMLMAFRDSLRAAGEGPALSNDVMTHCALARLSEVDDIHLASMTTPGSIVIPAAMTIAATRPDIDIGDVAVAMLAGYEAMVRLGLAIKGPDILYRGIWPTYFGTGFATAAVAARLLRLDRKQTAHALAMALTLSAPSVGQYHGPATARWLSVGVAAQKGLTAALAVRAGFAADINVLNSRLLPNVYGIEAEPCAIANGPGGGLVLGQVSFKPWCAARQTMAATQALRELIDEGLAVADITGIEAYVLPPHRKMIDHGVELGDRASALTSLPYQLAVAARRPERSLALEQPAAACLPVLADFMAGITVTPDEALLADYPRTWPARIVVATGSGQYERTVSVIPGDPARAFGEADVGAKLQNLLVPVIGDKEAASFARTGLAAMQSLKDLQSATQAAVRLTSVKPAR